MQSGQMFVNANIVNILLKNVIDKQGLSYRNQFKPNLERNHSYVGNRLCRQDHRNEHWKPGHVFLTNRRINTFGMLLLCAVSVFPLNVLRRL